MLFLILLVSGDGSKSCSIQNIFVVEYCESEIAVVSDVMTHKEHDFYGVFCSSYWKKKKKRKEKSLDYWLWGLVISQPNMPDRVYTDNNRWMCEQACGASVQSVSLRARFCLLSLLPTLICILCSPAFLSDGHDHLLLSRHYCERCDLRRPYWFMHLKNVLVDFQWNWLTNLFADLLPQQLPDSIVTHTACWQQHTQLAPQHSTWLAFLSNGIALASCFWRRGTETCKVLECY